MTEPLGDLAALVELQHVLDDVYVLRGKWYTAAFYADHVANTQDEWAAAMDEAHAHFDAAAARATTFEAQLARLRAANPGAVEHWARVHAEVFEAAQIARAQTASEHTIRALAAHWRAVVTGDNRVCERMEAPPPELLQLILVRLRRELGWPEAG